MTRLVPGSTPVVAHEALHYVIVFSIPLAAACLARRVSRDAGWFAAAAAALIGGFGWIAAHAPAFITSPSDARFGADLVVASPNSVYELFPPAFPRELGLVLLGATAVLIAFAVAHLDRRSAAVAGVAMGMVGLVSVPMLVSALLWAAAATIVVPRGKRSVYLTSIFGAAVVVFALWAGPVVGNYVHYGGFVNITPQLGKEWALPTSLASWGFLLPLTIAGVVVAARMRVREKRLLIAFGVAAAALLVLALAREAFGWQLAGNATLLHQGRAWPPTHLLAGVFGGIALAFGYEALKRRSRATAATALATVLVLGAVSPALAAIRMTGILHGHADGFSYASADLQPGSFVRNASAHLSPNDVVRVRGNDTLAFFLFEFSGCRLASYDDPRLNGNDLRIRYADLARAWNRRMAAGGFRYDYIVVRASASLGSPEPVAEGSFDGVDYEMFRRVGGP
jgi:hypothetical protein